MKYSLKITQVSHLLGDWFEYELIDSTGQVIERDNIDDTGQGISVAREQIASIIRRRHTL